MKKTKKRFTTLTLLCFSFTAAQAQQAVVTSGGNASGSGGTCAYSIGQTVYTTHTSLTGSVAQGVQQPYEISTVLGINIDQISLEIEVFPNPTVDFLTLNVSATTLLSNQFMNVQLYETSGKLIESKTIKNSTEKIGMENMPTGTYFLKVMNNNKEIKTFKIIKN